MVIVSPLVDASSDQVDLVRASQAAGIPTVAAIASWDNLTNKGHMRVVPDLVTVWNEQQREEATTLHGVPGSGVAVTGAQLFDRWFERRAEPVARGVLRDGRPAGGSPVRALHRLVGLHRALGVRGAVRPPLDGHAAEQRTPAAARRGDPRASASVQLRCVGARGLQRFRAGGRLAAPALHAGGRRRRGTPSSIRCTTARRSSASTRAR